MSTLVHRRWNFPAHCDAKSIVMRETNGIDEQNAALQADVRGKRSSIYQELVRLSIVKVDDADVIQPFAQLEGWSSRTRALVNKAYEDLNDLEDDEVATFLAMGADPETGELAHPPPEDEQEDGDLVSIAK